MLKGEQYYPCPTPKGVASFLHGGVISPELWAYAINLERDRWGGFSPVINPSPVFSGTETPKGQVFLGKTFADKNDNKWIIVFYRDTYSDSIFADVTSGGEWFGVSCKGAGGYERLTFSMAGIPEATSARGVLWFGNKVDPVCSLDMSRRDNNNMFVAIKHDGTPNNGLLGTATYNLPRGHPTIFRNRLALVGPPGEEDTIYFSLLRNHAACGVAGALGMSWKVDSEDGDRIMGFISAKDLYLFKKYAIYLYSGEFDDDQVGSDGSPRASGFWAGSLRLDKIEGLYGAINHRQIGLHSSGRIIYRSWEGWRSLMPPPPGTRVEKGTSHFTEREDYLFQDRLRGGGLYGATAPDDPAGYKSGAFDCDTYEDWLQGTVSGLSISQTLGGIRLVGEDLVKQTATAWAISSAQGYLPEYAIDGNLNTYWAVATKSGIILAGYLMFDFGVAPSPLTKILLWGVDLWGYGGGENGQIDLLYGDFLSNGVIDERDSGSGIFKSWTCVGSGDVSEGHCKVDHELIVPGIAKRYWELRGVHRSSKSNAKEMVVTEAEFYSGTNNPLSGTYTSKVIELPATASRWGVFKVWHRIMGGDGGSITYNILVSEGGTEGPWESVELTGLADFEGQIDLNTFLSLYPPNVWRWAKVEIELSGTTTVSPSVYRFMATWIEGEVEALLQGCGMLGESFYAALSHGGTFDEVHIKSRDGDWMPIRYDRDGVGNIQPSSFFEYNGVFYATNGCQNQDYPADVLMSLNSGDCSIFVAMTASYDCGIPTEDKEFTSLLVTYQHKCDYAATPQEAMDISYNVDDEFKQSPTGNLINDLAWHRLNSGASRDTIVIDNSGALTTIRLPLPILYGNTKGRRIRFKFDGKGILVILHNWMVGYRMMGGHGGGGLGVTQTGIDPRTDYDSGGE